MPSAFFIDPTSRTVKPCDPALVDTIKNRIGQAHYDIVFSTETPDCEIVEYSATVWPHTYAGYDNAFELAGELYRYTAILVVHTDDKLAADMIPAAF